MSARHSNYSDTFRELVAEYWHKHRINRDGIALNRPTHPAFNGAPEARDLFIMTTGVAGEAGEVVELLKKHVRDGEIDVHHLAEEIGDTQFFLAKVAMTYGIDQATIVEIQRAKLAARYGDAKATPYRIDRGRFGLKVNKVLQPSGIYVLATDPVTGETINVDAVVLDAESFLRFVNSHGPAPQHVVDLLWQAYRHDPIEAECEGETG